MLTDYAPIWIIVAGYALIVSGVAAFFLFEWRAGRAERRTQDQAHAETAEFVRQLHAEATPPTTAKYRCYRCNEVVHVGEVHTHPDDKPLTYGDVAPQMDDWLRRRHSERPTREPSGRFAKGVSGNPKGRPRKPSQSDG